MREWDIYIARETARLLGTARATDADAAIEEAVRVLGATNPKKLFAIRRR